MSEPRNRLMPDDMDKFVMDGFRRQLDQAALLVGEQKARQLWEGAAKRPRGKPKGSTRPYQDKKLLEIYDWLVAQPERPYPIESLPRLLGQHLDESAHLKFGATATAITTRLRRALKARDEEAAARSRLPAPPLDPTDVSK